MRNVFRIGWLARTLALFVLMLTSVSASAKNSNWWSRSNGVEIIQQGNSYITIRYLSYMWTDDDTDDALHDLDVYLCNGNKEVLIMSHKGNHKGGHKYHNKDVDWNNGYGNRTYHNGASVCSTRTWEENASKEKWVEVELKNPLWAWGKDWKLRTKGAWYYWKEDNGKYNIDFYSNKFDLGSQRIKDKLMVVYYKSGFIEGGDKLSLNVEYLSDLSSQTTVDVKLTLGNDVVKTLKGVKAINDYLSVDLPKSFDITNDFDVKAEFTVKDGRNDPVEKTLTTKVDGYAKVTRINADYHTLDNKVTVTWDAENTSQAKCVSVFRRRTGSSSWTAIATKLDKNTKSVTDTYSDKNQFECGKEYEYKIIYTGAIGDRKYAYSMMGMDFYEDVYIDWPDPTGSENWAGIGTKTFKPTPELNMDLTTERGKNGVDLSWKIPSNDVLKDCKYQIMRCPVDMNVWEVAYEGGTLKASTKANESSATGNYEDKDLDPGTYKYKIVVDASQTMYKTKFESAEQKCQTISVASIAELNATKGEYAGRVHLDWHMKYFQGTVSNKFTLFRRDANDKKSEWTTMYNTSSTDEFMSWDDDMALPGKYYEYKLQLDCVTNDEKHSKISTERTVIGFSSASGKVLGHITYGTGTAVEGVDVMAKRNGTDDGETSSRALEFLGNYDYASFTMKPEKFEQNFFGPTKSWSIQMWVKPDAMAGEATLMADFFACMGLGLDKDGHPCAVGEMYQQTSTYQSVWHPFSELTVPTGKYSHLTLTHDGENQFTVYLATVNDSTGVAEVQQQTRSDIPVTDYDFSELSEYIERLGLGLMMGQTYDGKMDEARLWSRALTEKEVRDNYNRALVGNESGLEAYFRFDEGLKTMFFDSSRKGTVYNNHHGTMEPSVTSSYDVPSTEELAYRCKTDYAGNYTIEGIPFSGEGTSYSIIPTLGIHEFNPKKEVRFIGPNSLVHNSTDFTDVSSFPVSGVVYYEGTTYPVEGCSFYIDGQVCSKDGNMIKSREDGTFNIDVPIGDHFIQVKLDGHVFAERGCYPADPDSLGLKHNFDRAITGLTFYDKTLVNLSGRVTGGDIEGKKPLGFGESKNLIGQAELVLIPQDDRYRLNVVKEVTEGSISYETNTENLFVPRAENATAINSQSWRGSGDSGTKRIYINTDPKTGEFSAMVPPLKYVLESAKVKKTAMNVAEPNSQLVDLSNARMEYKDSLQTEDGTMQYYKYSKALRLTYHAAPTFTVTDRYADEGAFGIRDYVGEDDYGELTVDSIYTVADDGKVTYRFGHPIFIMMEPYKFKITGYEEYTNYDEQEAYSTRVPLKDTEVTIANELAATQAVYNEGENEGQVGDLQHDKLTLNDKGEAIYSWMGGLPNISEPYTRTISMYFNIDGKRYEWSGNGMACYILGDLITGSNFVTAGPDKVDMVLRDPPGSKSSASWTKGKVTTTTTADLKSGVGEEKVVTTHHVGGGVVTGVGFGLLQINTNEIKFDVVGGIKSTWSSLDGKTTLTEIETSREISTSDDPEFVGTKGDLFIGSSSNISYGASRLISLRRPAPDAEPEITRTDALSSNLQYKTNFIYSQFFIENTMIPNFHKIIDDNLIYADMASIEKYKVTENGKTFYRHNGDQPLYLTPLKPGDKGYGSSNKDEKYWENAKENSVMGPSYWVIAPNTNEVYGDTILWLNNQIKLWEGQLAKNEEDKVNAYHIDTKYRGDNISFDGGAEVKFSKENSDGDGEKHSYDWATLAVVGGKTGWAVNWWGLELEISTENGGGNSSESESMTVDKASFTYTLKEEGWDALSVQVCDSPAGWSTLFHTVAGQTSNPYEGEERTRYHKPGLYTLHEATMKMEVPKITVEKPIVNNVPAGGNAVFNMKLSNESEVDYDYYFLMFADDKTNPNGASIKMDGAALGMRKILVPAGQTLTKTLIVSQTRPDILDYENIRIILASETQNDPTSTMDVIADTVSISAHFVPSASEATLHTDYQTLNEQTGTVLNLSFDGFNRNYHGQKAFKLQYQPKGAPSWTDIKVYVLNEDDKTDQNELLPDAGVVTLVYDAKSMPDGEYSFRVLSVSMFGSGEVTRESNVVDVVKDMAVPMLVSLPSPSDGVLNVGDEISVVFNEDIRSGYVNKADNFIVRGRLNGAVVKHDGVYHNAGGEGAVTQAPIDLTSHAFTIGCWVKWTGAGTVWKHGTTNNYMDCAIEADGKVKVTINGKDYTSSDVVPQDKWCYLNVSYNPNNGDARLTADVAWDAFTKNLFDRERVETYKGNGTLAIGGGLTGSIHEVSLWNSAQPFNSSEIYSTKSRSTAGLIGYWPLDEGHGTVGEDKARSRHIIMAEGNNWSMEQRNYALPLDGSQQLRIDMTKANSDVDENYLVEFWVKSLTPTLSQGEGDATLFTIAGNKMSMEIEKDNLVLKAAGQSIINCQLSIINLLNSNWHHVALNVLQGTSGMATLYVDGNAVGQANAKLLPPMQTDFLTMGAGFKGEIDEVRYWLGTYSAEAIRSNIYNKVQPDAPGLAAYYPFEKTVLDSGNQPVAVADMADHSTKKSADAAVYTAAGALVSSPEIGESALGLKAAPELENVAFSFVASERKLLITIDEQPQRIEGCQLELTVRSVQDLHENFCKPVTWTAYVQQNQLVWGESEVKVTKEGTDDAAFDVDIINTSGSMADWSITGMPLWLSTANTSGSLLPLTSKTLTFTVDPGTAIGHYEAVLKLCGANGVTADLVVSLTVTGERPEWAVDPTLYENSMTVVAQVKVDGVYSEDVNDIVGAFIGGECRGVASPVYYPRYDAYYVTLNVFGNKEGGSDVTFKLFDASVGDVYPKVDASESVKFKTDNVYGTFTKPVILSANESREQMMALERGWNWMSLYVAGDSIQTVMSSVAREGVSTKSQRYISTYEKGRWIGTLDTLDNYSMYKVRLDAERTFDYIGKLVQPDTVEITLAKGNNWIGYPVNGYMPLNEAFAGLEPNDGDVVKSQRAFAMYLSGEWVGTLTAMTPGAGYIYRNTGESKTFHYPALKPGSIMKAPKRVADDGRSLKYESCDIHKYPGNMNIIAQAVVDGQPVECEIAAFDSNGECRGSSLSLVDDDNLVFLTIHGEGTGEPLTFRVVYYDGDNEIDVEAAERCTYKDDDLLGTPSAPFVFDLEATDGIATVADGSAIGQPVYNLQGLPVDKKTYKGVMITKNKKVLRK